MAGSDPSEPLYTNYRAHESSPKPLKDDHQIHINICNEENGNDWTPLSRVSPSTLYEPNLSIASTFKQIALAVSFLAIAVLFNFVILAVIHERVPFSQPPLPDVTFELLPKHDRALDICEYLIMFMTCSMFSMILLHRYRSLIFRRACLVFAIVYLFRAICMGVTQLPVANPQYYCSPQLNSTANLQWWNFTKIIFFRVSYMSIGLGFSMNGRHSFCGDYIYSGHTIMLVTTYFFLNEYWLSTRIVKLKWRLLKLIYFSLVCLGIVCILIARGHYSVDIVLAYFISSRVFYLYHCMCDFVYNEHLTKQAIGKNRLRHLWWHTLFTYVESDTIQHNIKVQNVFDFFEFYCLNSKSRCDPFNVSHI